VTFGESERSCTCFADNAEAIVTIRKPDGMPKSEPGWNRLLVQPLVGGMRVEPVAVDMLNSPEPVRITIPPTGRMVVRAPGVRALFGEPLCPLVLITASAAEQGPQRWYESGQVMGGIALPDGRFLFPFVALNQRFATVPIAPSTFDECRPDHPGGLAQQTLDGPRVPGETIEIDLAPDREAPVLAATLVDENGAVRAATRVELEVVFPCGDRKGWKQFQARTGDNGRLELPLPRYLDSVRPEHALLQVLDEDGQETGAARWLECPVFRLGKQVELGTFTLSKPPRLLTLQVAQPLARALTYRLEFHREDVAGSDTWEPFEPEFCEWREGGSVYYTHRPERRWRLVCLQRSLPAELAEAAAWKIEFEAGAGPVEVTGRGP